jgi:alkylation response protein AidB-like acyl-CoA dehydrogenase
MAEPQPRTICSPNDPALDELCRQLASRGQLLDLADAWPGGQLEVCAQYGVFQWFLSREWGGQGWSEIDVTQGYLKLAAACLTTTFVITQRTGACQRIAQSENESLKEELLGDLAAGRKFATVGISHLSTSRRHLSKPVLRASDAGDAFVLNGMCPWVTGAAHADTIVTGATLQDDRQVLLAVPRKSPGLTIGEPVRMVGLTASHTGEMRLRDVQVPKKNLLAGPAFEVMKSGIGAKSGGFQTSTLALGLTKAALDFLDGECRQRRELSPWAEQLRADWDTACADLNAAVEGTGACSAEQLRTRANDLVLRASQAALAAAKGSGYITGHPAGRFCRESLFFLVWSCPRKVVEANLCQFAGIANDP